VKIMLKDFIQVSGREFTVNNRKILLRGFGVGCWMNIEHFMIGLPGTESLIRSTLIDVFGKSAADTFFDAYLSNFLSEGDFEYLSSLGINALRLPVNYHYFIDDQDTDNFLADGFKYLDNALKLCEKYRIYAIIDLHAAPGGQNPDWHSDNNTGMSQFWHFRCFRDQAARLWGHIAGRYADNPWVGGYDLLNEPFMIPDKNILNDFFAAAVAEIRKVDKNHVIFLEGDHFAMDFSMVKIPPDPQAAIEFHYYPTVWHPEALSKSMPPEKRTAIFTESFNEMLKLREQFDRPVWCGELGCVISRDDPDFTWELDREMLELCEKNCVSWTIWAYKDSQWMGLVYPDDGAPWIKLTNNIRKRWSIDGEMETANEILDLVGEKYFGKIDEELKYKLQFRLRTLLHVIYTEHILKPELRKLTAEQLLQMPGSFRFENCRRWKPLEDIIRGFTGS